MLSSPPPPAYRTHQVIRTVEPPASPFAGAAARAPDGSTVLLVDRAATADLPGWSAPDDAHVFAPREVIRRTDGHDVVFPLLREGVDEFLRQRRDADAPLSGGEAVTLAVSIVRGVTASMSRHVEAEGEWWLDDDGRPLLVEGVGAVSILDTSTRLLRTVAEDVPRTRLAAALTSIADAAASPGFDRYGVDAEDALFACADPEPLVTEVFGPRRVRRRSPEPSTAAPEPTPTIWQRLAFHVDADLAATASDALNAALRSIRRPASRRRPLIIAGVLAVAIVAIGLLWPSGADEAAAPAAAVSGMSATAGADDSETAGPVDVATGAPVTPQDDPAVIASDLLDRRIACSDTACLASVLEDPARDLPDGVVDQPTENRRSVLIDDLGGVVVVRIESISDGAVQLVTIVDSEDGWRIRDVHDVTDAPS